MPIFRVKSVKIYTGQKKFTRVYPWLPWQIWGMVVMVVIFMVVIGHGGKNAHNGHGQDRQDSQDTQDRQDEHERQNRHSNLTFQVTCVGHLSQFLQCFLLMLLPFQFQFFWPTTQPYTTALLHIKVHQQSSNQCSDCDSCCQTKDCASYVDITEKDDMV